jgi:DnaK suppressor protein
MTEPTQGNGAPNYSRYDDLKRILEDRRAELTREVNLKQKDVRTKAGNRSQGVIDLAECGSSDNESDIDLALIQMRAETLKKVEAALMRLEEGTYGNCFECGDEISQNRLRALPFAARCRDCEESREVAINRDRSMVLRSNR